MYKKNLQKKILEDVSIIDYYLKLNSNDLDILTESWVSIAGKGLSKAWPVVKNLLFYGLILAPYFAGSSGGSEETQKDVEALKNYVLEKNKEIEELKKQNVRRLVAAGLVGTTTGIGIGAYFALKNKLTKELDKALDEGDFEKAKKIREKIQKLNKVMMALGITGGAAAAITPIILSKAKRSS